MTIRERRPRERSNLREDILSAARSLAAQDGWQHVTIRKVAEQIEYSPPMIYEHFESKEAMLVALMREGFTQLHNAIQHAYNHAKGPRAAVRAIALAYCRFAWQSPELYQVMFGLGSVPLCRDPLPEEISAVYKTTSKAIEELRTKTQAHISNCDDAVEILWASLHGVIALAMAEQITGGLAQVERLCSMIVNNLLIAWQAIGDD
jgi:AcrR family transcriptional regulator